jgi:hypothetical protein
MVFQIPNVVNRFFQARRLVYRIDNTFINNRIRLDFAPENPHAEQSVPILERYAVASFGFQFKQSRNNPID